MNKIHFDRMTIQNFMSIGPMVEFNFKDHNGLNYIFGTNRDIEGSRNGVGKSAYFVDSLTFILFGQTVRGVPLKYIPNRQMPRKVPTDLSLTFEFQGATYLIQCGFHQAPYSPHFRLYKNGEDLSKATIKETRAFLEKEILHMSYNIFKNSIILSSSSSSNFFTFKKSDRRVFVEDIFNLTVFGEMLKQTRTDSNSVDREILSVNSINRQIVATLKELENSDNNFLIEKEKKLKEIKEKLEFKEKRIVELRDLIKADTDEKAKVTVLDRTVTQAQFDKLRDGLNKVDHIIKIADKEIKHCNEIINEYKDVLAELCTGCKTTIETKFNVGKSHESIKANEAKILQYKAIQDTLTKQQDVICLQLKVINDNEKTIQGIDKKLQHNQWVIDHLIGDIKELKEEAVPQDSPFKGVIAEHNTKIVENNTLLNSYFIKRKYYDLLQTVLDENGAKRFIIKDLITLLNSRIKRYLYETGANFTCIFDTSFNCEFLTETGGCQYENFSAGERARIDIAVLFAFRDILINLKSVNMDIIVIDEFLDSSLDNFAISAIIKLLKQVIDVSGQTVYLISHRECVDSGEDFDNVIELEKNGGFTNIISDLQGSVG